jgi:hypothetical protein
MRLLLLLILSGNLFLLNSCKRYQAAKPSFFIQSDTITVLSPDGRNDGSHKITDLWLYIDGQFQGAYATGHLMPIPSDNKSVRLNVFAGIKNNGISDTRLFYPFWDFLIIDTLVSPGSTVKRNFTFRYKTATTFTWTENFESGSGFSLENVNSDTTFHVASPQESLHGRSLKLALAGKQVRARIESAGEGFSLPTASGNVYLEINYKCNTPFTVGLVSPDRTQSAAAMVLNPQENWNKIYIQLSTAVNTIISSRYKVYFEFVKDPAVTETKQLFLDNIKLIYL